MATAAGSVKGRARFAAACDALSRYVKAAATEARPPPPAAQVALPLMPGADLSSSTAQQEPEPASGAAQAQLTIFYGGRVLVLDDVPAGKAAELLRLAASAAAAPAENGQGLLPAADDDLPVARKASLQRFMERRQGRVAARAAPYLRPDDVAGPRACPDRLSLAL